MKEKEKLVLECELNKLNKPVQWFKNGKEIVPDNERITASIDQYLRQLVIADVTVEDAAKYTCKCGDVSTECTIKVEGKAASKFEILASFVNILHFKGGLVQWVTH